MDTDFTEAEFEQKWPETSEDFLADRKITFFRPLPHKGIKDQNGPYERVRDFIEAQKEAKDQSKSSEKNLCSIELQSQILGLLLESKVGEESDKRVGDSGRNGRGEGEWALK